MTRIYLDHAATTPVSPAAAKAMEPWIHSGFGNPSSLHESGRTAKDAIDQAREIISEGFGCEFGEVLFTSSGTESCNMAIIGAAIAAIEGPRKRIFLGSADHHCVLHTQEMLAVLGYSVETIPVDQHGMTRLEWLKDNLSDNVLLVSVLHANNELGTIQPAEQISQMCKDAGTLFHCDAVQSFTQVRQSDFWPDMCTFSAHKFGGPKGAGGLFLKAGTKLKPLIVGGGQEREMRAGTENTAAIAGTGAAYADRSSKDYKFSAEQFLSKIAVNHVRTVPHGIPCLPNIVHLRFPGVSAETLLILLDRLGVEASAGAACSSGSLEPSHVLLACGFDETSAKEGVRFSFGPETTEEMANEAANRINEAVTQICG